MAETRKPRPSRQPVVRPLSRATGRPCARPGCPSPSRATLTFSYATQEVWLEPLRDEPPPHAYDLCPAHADRTQPPKGWTLVDERSDDADGAGSSGEFGGERTVAVLAAALHGRRPLPEQPDSDDPLREALEELQAVELPDAGGDIVDDLRLVDRETRRRRRAAAMEAIDGDGIRSTVEQARRAAADLVRGSSPRRGTAPGRPVPAANDRPDDARPGRHDDDHDHEDPATLW